MKKATKEFREQILKQRSRVARMRLLTDSSLAEVIEILEAVAERRPIPGGPHVWHAASVLRFLKAGEEAS